MRKLALLYRRNDPVVTFLIAFAGALCLGNFANARTADSLKAPKPFSNYVKLSHGGFHVKDWHNLGNPFSNGQPGLYQKYVNAENVRQGQYVTIGIAYERKVYKNWFMCFSFYEWKDLFNLSSNTFSINHLAFAPASPGDVYTRYNYKMADVYALYKWNVGHGQHYVNVGAGASYCWGKDDFVKYFNVNPAPPYDISVILDQRKASYWGVVPCVGYDFLFFHNRINIGPDLHARIYSKGMPVEYDLNFHFGVNF